MRGFGPRGLIVHGANPARLAALLADLGMGQDGIATLACGAEPSLPMLETALVQARAHKPDWVLGLGGGSVMDLAKALAGLIPAKAGPMDHLEVVGRGLPLTEAPLPFIAIPTTAGTGAEATKNARICGSSGAKPCSPFRACFGNGWRRSCRRQPVSDWQTMGATRGLRP